ncbi:MAG: hypothetical protein Q9198_009457, partial [Flavoplaca austrocitrina]
RKATRTTIDGPTIDTPSVRKRKTKPTPAEEHGQDTHTSAGPSPNKRRKVAAPLPTPTSMSPYAPTASPTAAVTPPVRCEDVAAGGKGGRGLDGGYWDLTAMVVGEVREKGGEVKVEGKGDGKGDGARRSGRVTRKSVRFAL